LTSTSPSERGEHVLPGRFHAGGVRHVEGDGQGATSLRPHLAGDLFGGRGVQLEDRDVGAGAGQRQGDAAADALATTRDDRALPGEVHDVAPAARLRYVRESGLRFASQTRMPSMFSSWP
jgi:hypothetical protein